MIDLIDECGQDLLALGYETFNLPNFNMTSNKLFVDTRAKSKALGFDIGHYFVLNCPKINYLMEEHHNAITNEMLCRLKFLFKKNKLKKSDRVLCVGIGNPNLPADSFGARVVEKINFQPFKKSNHVFKIIPNIFSNTGINSFEMIKVIVEAFDIDYILLFDSLATSNFSRLGSSLQFNDAGLTPGSALNNFGMTINKASIGVPCIAVGVPFLISSKCFGYKSDVMLTEKDVDEKVEFMSKAVADVVNNLL